MYLGPDRGARDVAASSTRRPLHPVHGRPALGDPGAGPGRSRAVVAGSSSRATCPRPVDPPSGCRFHTRCWLRERLGNPETCADRGSGAAGARRAATRWPATSPRRSTGRSSRAGPRRPVERPGDRRVRSRSARRRRNRPPPADGRSRPTAAAGLSRTRSADRSTSALDSARDRAHRPRPARTHARGPRGQPGPASRAARRGARRGRRPRRLPGARADRLPAPGPGRRGRDAPRRSPPGGAWWRRRAGCRRSCRSSRSRPIIGCSSPPPWSRTGRSATSTASCSCRPTACSTSAGSSPPAISCGPCRRVSGSALGLAVCEDFWHLAVPQLLALDGAQILINVSSSPGRDLAAHQRGRPRHRDLVAACSCGRTPS